ncbi:MAG: signal recognition particle-docking protein FtsY [Caldimonas sp.]
MFSFFKKKPAVEPPPAPAAKAVSPSVERAPEPGPSASPSWRERLGGWVVPKPAAESAEATSGSTSVSPAASAPIAARSESSTASPVRTPESEPEMRPGLPTRPSAASTEPAEALRTDWMAKLRSGLKKTGSTIALAFTGAQVGDELYEDLETALLQADAGIEATEYLLDDLRWRVKRAEATRVSEVKDLLAEAIAALLAPLERPLRVGEFTPTVMMVVGVNGAGKTTTIGKLTRHLVNARQKVMLAAADTFRAAAREQLAVWADRADLPASAAGGRVDIVSQEGGDPAGVTFDAVVAAKARGCDVVIADTAGRLTTQAHLMEELKKIRRVIAKAQDGAPHEILLVLDGNTGQNALAQVQVFDTALQLTGLVITKLDGTAKGGVLAAIALWVKERGSPLAVYFIGVGEKLEDLQTFSAREFADALVGRA